MNLNDPKYKHVLPFPNKPSKPSIDPWKVTGVEVEAIKSKYEADLQKWQEARNAWDAEEFRINTDFRRDALEDVGLLGHPKESKAYTFAWDRGHANGFGDVYYWLDEIADILKD